jgi:hypothetical protein
MSLQNEIIVLAIKQEKAGIPLIDLMIADATDQSRMITEEEEEELKKAA